MNFFFLAVFFVVGFYLMTFGAEYLVTAGSTIAAYFRISPLIIGLTIVSFGTSLPEFAASFMGALHGRTDIALGNVVGSNICNLGLVLGAAAVTRPIRVQSGLIRREIPFVLAVSIFTWIMVSNSVIQRLEGLLLVTLFYSLYLVLHRLGEAAGRHPRGYARRCRHLRRTKRREIGPRTRGSLCWC